MSVGDYRGVPAGIATSALPLDGVEVVVVPGARVLELRFVFEPHAADAVSENDEIARIVSTAKIFFMTSSESNLV